jgi:hypothetical protein
VVAQLNTDAHRLESDGLEFGTVPSLKRHSLSPSPVN